MLLTNTRLRMSRTSPADTEPVHLQTAVRRATMTRKVYFPLRACTEAYPML